jgi:subtilase family serine protease
VIAANNDLFIQAGTEGIGMYFASGDEGDNKVTLGYRTVEWPSASPYATGVGGTSLGLGVGDQYLFETGWGTTNSYLVGNEWKPRPPGAFYYGGTGGTSRIIAEPWYQMGVVPDSLSGYWGGANRVVPDIAMNGDPTTPILVGETQRFPDGSIRYAETAFGGTSLSTPLMAGVMALADQRAGFAHGFANPMFYDIQGTSALHDVVNPGTKIAAVRTNFNNGVDASAGKYFVLRTFNQTGTLHTKPGYDDVTGVGTPNGEAFLDAMSGP